jgi:hypothetical protein
MSHLPEGNMQQTKLAKKVLTAFFFVYFFPITVFAQQAWDDPKPITPYDPFDENYFNYEPYTNYPYADASAPYEYSEENDPNYPHDNTTPGYPDGYPDGYPHVNYPYQTAGVNDYNDSETPYPYNYYDYFYPNSPHSSYYHESIAATNGYIYEGPAINGYLYDTMDYHHGYGGPSRYQEQWPNNSISRLTSGTTSGSISSFGKMNFGRRRFDNSDNFSSGISSYQGTSTGPGPNGGYPGTPRGIYQTNY